MIVASESSLYVSVTLTTMAKQRSEVKITEDYERSINVSMEVWSQRITKCSTIIETTIFICILVAATQVPDGRRVVLSEVTLQ